MVPRRDERADHRSGGAARAFTLIEVLVVVAIIALLLAILLPSLKKARDQVKVVACQTNLHDFGNAFHQYANDFKGYFALPSYIGCTTWFDNPGADDNLLVLWMRRYTRNVATYTCPATRHRVRVPQRIERVAAPNNKGFEYQVFTGGQRRNDFEFHAQLVTQLVQLPAAGYVQVNGFGTSYEYGGWLANSNVTAVNWWPLNKKFSRVNGEPMGLRNIRQPSRRMVMKDADEGGSTGTEVVGAPPGKATNNIPEAWDNHGAKLCNVLYADAHVEALGLGFWETYMREHPAN